MVLQLSGKQRAARVPMNYHERPDRWKRWLTVLAGVATMGLLAACLASGNWKQTGSPGPVHNVHAAWEADCNRCHVPFQPTAAANPLAPLLTSARSADLNCQACHAGPAHHSRQMDAEVESCAGCHREHRGRDVSLTNVGDSACTRCHANLPGHVVGGSSLFASSVTQFDASHPRFRVEDATGGLVPLSIAKDPGKLNFSHRLHMTPGLKPSPDDPDRLELRNVRPLTLGDIRDAQARESYAKQQAVLGEAGRPTLPSDNQLVRLRCAACHQLDAGEVFASPNTARRSSPSRSAGAYMLPVSYESHCRACHPLTLDNAMSPTEIPHGLQPEDVRRFLWGAYSEHRIAQAPAAPGPSRPLPGESSSRVEKKVREEIDARTKEEEGALFPKAAQQAEIRAYAGKATCGLCHQYDKQPGAILPTRILPPALVNVWFPHAAFDHRSHRAVSCLECHQDAQTSMSSAAVMLPDLETCLKCHGSSPAPMQAVQHGLIRSKCTTCHRYHNADHPAQGLGAAARAPKDPLDLKRFLSN